MTPRRPASPLLVLLTLPLALTLAGCTKVTAISIVPGPGVEVLTAVGQTAQYKAAASEQMGSANPTTSDITNSVTWAATNTAVATISSTGLATATGAGFTQITAESNGVIATSDITVTIPGSGTGTGTPSLSVIPVSVTETFVGETTQYTASGNLTGTGNSQNLTTQVQWVSSNAQVATVSAGGLATAVGAGTTTITAESGGLNASATLTVAVNAATTSLTIIPSTGATATFAGETTQFIALGNLTGSGATQNLTANVAWYSSDVAIATIDQAGLATAVSANIVSSSSTTITAIGTTTSGSLITATTTLTVMPAGGSVNLPTLAVYMVGTGSGTVTSLPIPIVCGSQATGTICTGNFQLNATVTLTATPAPLSVFGGWSANCTPVAGNPLQCTVQMKNNETVGAIFNP